MRITTVVLGILLIGKLTHRSKTVYDEKSFRVGLADEADDTS